MHWVGSWRNQYGSELQIIEADQGVLSGYFRTALTDSAFFGHDLSISGITRGPCINFAFGEESAGGATIASFTGTLLGDVIETLWFVVSHRPDRTEPWPHAVAVNHDTFTRV
jgi:hypothetical protein